jgi:hypothetical protein
VNFRRATARSFIKKVAEHTPVRFVFCALSVVSGTSAVFYQPDARTFAVIDRDLAERLVGRD